MSKHKFYFEMEGVRGMKSPPLGCASFYFPTLFVFIFSHYNIFHQRFTKLYMVSNFKVLEIDRNPQYSVNVFHSSTDACIEAKVEGDDK
jgi:hypothetical protein